MLEEKYEYIYQLWEHYFRKHKKDSDTYKKARKTLQQILTGDPKPFYSNSNTQGPVSGDYTSRIFSEDDVIYALCNLVLVRGKTEHFKRKGNDYAYKNGLDQFFHNWWSKEHRSDFLLMLESGPREISEISKGNEVYTYLEMRDLHNSILQDVFSSVETTMKITNKKPEKQEQPREGVAKIPVGSWTDFEFFFLYREYFSKIPKKDLKLFRQRLTTFYVRYQNSFDASVKNEHDLLRTFMKCVKHNSWTVTEALLGQTWLFFKFERYMRDVWRCLK